MLTWASYRVGLLPKHGSTVWLLITLGLILVAGMLVIVIPVQGLGHMMAGWTWPEVKFYLSKPGLYAAGMYLLLVLVMAALAAVIPNVIQVPTHPTSGWYMGMALVVLVIGASAVHSRRGSSPWLYVARGLYGWYDPRFESPSYILKPERGPEPFQRRYYQNNADTPFSTEEFVERWAQGDGEHVALFLSGAAGTGKTRLAHEIEKKAHDWRLGYIRVRPHFREYHLGDRPEDPLVDIETGSDAVEIGRQWYPWRGLFIFVDHALSREAKETRQIIESAVNQNHEMNGQKPVRILFADRSRDDMKEMADDIGSHFPSGAVAYIDLSIKECLDSEDLESMFCSAYDFYARKLGMKERALAPDLVKILKQMSTGSSHSVLNRPLAMNVFALGAVLDAQSHSTTGSQSTDSRIPTMDSIMETLLNHERDYWRRTVARLKFPIQYGGPLQRRLEQFFALRTLTTQPSESDDDWPIDEDCFDWMIQCVDPNHHASNAQWRMLLHHLYPSGVRGGIGGIWPRELADYLTCNEFGISMYGTHVKELDGSQKAFVQRAFASVPNIETCVSIVNGLQNYIHMYEHVRKDFTTIHAFVVWDKSLAEGISKLHISAQLAEHAWSGIEPSGTPGWQEIAVALSMQWARSSPDQSEFTIGGIENYYPGQAFIWLENTWKSQMAIDAKECVRVSTAASVAEFFAESRVGQDVLFGPWRWTVLSQDENEAMLLSTYIVGLGPFHSVLTDATWEESTVRQELQRFFFGNDDFQKVQNCIVVNRARETTKLIGVNNIAGKCHKSSIPTDGALYLLDEKELVSYIYRLDVYDQDKANISSARAHIPGSSTSRSWWMRSPGICPHTASLVFGALGIPADRAVTALNGIRPVLWLKIDRDYEPLYEDLLPLRGDEVAHPDNNPDLMPTIHGSVLSPASGIPIEDVFPETLDGMQ